MSLLRARLGVRVGSIEKLPDVSSYMIDMSIRVWHGLTLRATAGLSNPMSHPRSIAGIAAIGVPLVS